MPKKAGADFRLLLIPFILIVAITVVDQITKFMAVDFLELNETVSVWGTFFQLSLIYNQGGALGTNMGGSLFYLISSILILVFIFYLIYANRYIKPVVYPMAIIAGGAIGNIIDRVRIGRVVDFIDFDFVDVNIFGLQIERWWAFNIADAAITVGILFLLFFMLIASKHKPDQSSIITPE